MRRNRGHILNLGNTVSKLKNCYNLEIKRNIMCFKVIAMFITIQSLIFVQLQDLDMIIT